MLYDSWAKSIGVFLNISMCCQKCVYFFPELFSVEFLAQNVVFSFVCLNNLMMVLVSFPTKEKIAHVFGSEGFL